MNKNLSITISKGITSLKIRVWFLLMINCFNRIRNNNYSILMLILTLVLILILIVIIKMKELSLMTFQIILRNLILCNHFRNSSNKSSNSKMIKEVDKMNLILNQKRKKINHFTNLSPYYNNSNNSNK
jgi:1,4-dihydroxy-2-naphthoate octaprenyltransferase